MNIDIRNGLHIDSVKMYLILQMMASNPMFAGNPQLQEYMRTMLPTFLQQVTWAVF